MISPGNDKCRACLNALNIDVVASDSQNLSKLFLFVTGYNIQGIEKIKIKIVFNAK